MRLLKILSSCLKVSFLNEYTSINFFQYFPNFGGSKMLPYIRVFDRYPNYIAIH